jgi:hypothetical protein
MVGVSAKTATMMVADDDGWWWLQKLGDHETMRKENKPCYKTGSSMSLLTRTMSTILQWSWVVSPVPIPLLVLISVVLLLAMLLLPTSLTLFCQRVLLILLAKKGWGDNNPEYPFTTIVLPLHGWGGGGDWLGMVKGIVYFPSVGEALCIWAAEQEVLWDWGAYARVHSMNPVVVPALSLARGNGINGRTLGTLVAMVADFAHVFNIVQPLQVLVDGTIFIHWTIKKKRGKIPKQLQLWDQFSAHHDRAWRAGIKDGECPWSDIFPDPLHVAYNGRGGCIPPGNIWWQIGEVVSDLTAASASDTYNVYVFWKRGACNKQETDKFTLHPRDVLYLLLRFSIAWRLAWAVGCHVTPTWCPKLLW